MNCAEAGVIGAVAGVIGITQALQAIQLIVGHESFEPLIGKLWILDMHSMHAKTLAFPKKKTCPACSKKSEEIHLRYTSPVCDYVPEIAVSQLEKESGHILIDVREIAEWEQGHIEGAVLWPLSKIMAGYMPKEKAGDKIILYCQKGMRSLEAARRMRAYGFSDIASLSGGYEAWLSYVKNI